MQCFKLFHDLPTGCKPRLKDNTWGGQDGRRIDGRGVQMHQEYISDAKALAENQLSSGRSP